MYLLSGYSIIAINIIQNGRRIVEVVYWTKPSVRYLLQSDPHSRERHTMHLIIKSHSMRYVFNDW